MNRQRTYLLLLISLTCSQALPAQTDSTRNTPNPVTIKMIRATVEFLATDKKFGQKPRIPCEPCQSYEDLTRYVTQNKLMGADQLINEARKKSTVSTSAELQAFLLNRTTDGPRSYRKKLPSFAGYRQSLDTAVSGTETPESTTGLPVMDDSEDTASLVVTDDAVVMDETVAPKTDATLELMPHLSLIALIVALISLVGVVTLFWQRSRTPAESDPTTALDKLKKEVGELSRRLTILEKSEKQLSNTIQSGQRSQNQLLPRPAQTPAPEPEQPAPMVDVAPPIPPPLPAYNTPAPVTSTLRNVPTVQYGRTADLGDGFSVGGLVAAPDRDTVFEIYRQSDTAALYQVSDQPELQRLALSDAYSYLSETCNYLTQPRTGSRIQTDKPGKLSLQGDKWAIVEKAQISFQ